MKTQISDTKRDEIVSKLQQDIDAANAYYEETVEPKIIERYQIYNADKAFYAKMFPKLSKRCELVSTDVQDTIESTMPSLMKTFHGSTDVVLHLLHCYYYNESCKSAEDVHLLHCLG